MSEYVRGLRERIGHDVLEVPTVGVAVFDDARRILLVRHAEGDDWTTPGGMVEPYESPADAAVRETWEELGLPPGYASLAGYLRDYPVLTGYVITPAVAFVRPGFTLQLDRTEVDDVFEVPLDFVLDPAHHVPRTRTFAGHEFRTHDIPYGERHIWGATAGMLRNFYRLLTAA